VPAAGKTGTTSSSRDAWFAGYTGNYVATVWMGNDNFRATNRLTGGRLPAMIWQKFMEFAHTNIEVKPLFGVDFEPRAFASVTNANEGENPEAERPPNLSPQAAQKLLTLIDVFGDALKQQQIYATNPEEIPAPAIGPSPPDIPIAQVDTLN
ncbi:Multimodular transpeptidase-transglycosylase, partial [hydrothermal vent metagenome]